MHLQTTIISDFIYLGLVLAWAPSLYKADPGHSLLIDSLGQQLWDWDVGGGGSGGGEGGDSGSDVLTDDTWTLLVRNQGTDAQSGLSNAGWWTTPWGCKQLPKHGRQQRDREGGE